VAKPNGDAAWPWPESRLTYANAVLPEAMIAAGVALDDWALRQQGLDLLGWLIEYETAGDHLSPTPAGGRAPDDVRPAFDQQPIEVSTLADACARAATIDPASIWPNGVRAAAAWFMGANDARQLMWDPQPAVDSTACTPMGSTATRARSRLWQCSRRCNTLDDSRLCGNDFRAEWAPYTQPPTALGQPFAGHHPDSSCQARKVSSDRSPERERCWRGSWPWTKRGYGLR